MPVPKSKPAKPQDVKPELMTPAQRQARIKELEKSIAAREKRLAARVRKLAKSK